MNVYSGSILVQGGVNELGVSGNSSTAAYVGGELHLARDARAGCPMPSGNAAQIVALRPPDRPPQRTNRGPNRAPRTPQ